MLFENINGELLYNMAAIMSLLAYVLTNVLWLRVMIVCASSFYILSGLFLGITSMSAWNLAYFLINVFHIIRLLLDKSTVFLEDDVKKLYQKSFSALSSREFKKLIYKNQLRNLSDKKILTQGKETDVLYALVKGSAEVIKSGEVIATLKEGDLIGEMSFIAKRTASADVKVGSNTLLAYWTHKDLDNIQRKNITLYNKFISVIGIDLVNKLNQHSR